MHYVYIKGAGMAFPTLRMHAGYLAISCILVIPAYCACQSTLLSIMISQRYAIRVHSPLSFICFSPISMTNMHQAPRDNETRGYACLVAGCYWSIANYNCTNITCDINIWVSILGTRKFVGRIANLGMSSPHSVSG
jgi:hypothetical protein